MIFLALKRSDVEFILLINVKRQTIVCLFLFDSSVSQQFFSYVGTGHPGLNQY